MLSLGTGAHTRASEGNLAALRTEAERLIAASDAELDRVCAILAG